MADYQELPSVVETSFTSSSLSTETITAITTALSGTETVTVVTSIETTTIFTATETIVVTVDANFTGDLNQAAGDVDVIDGSSSDKGLDIDFSAKGKSAEQPENVTIGSDFDDIIVSNDNKQTIDAGDGDDSIATGAAGDSVSGGAGNDSISTGTGNDSISVGTGNDSVDGGTGFDVVAITSSFSQQTTSFNGSIFTSTDSSGNTVTIENTQVVTFGTNYQESQFILGSQSEKSIASLFGAFDRKAGPGGLEFFTGAADSPTGLSDVAQSMLESPEGQELNNADSTTFVTSLYTSFTQRTATTTETTFWTNSLDSGATTKSQVMSHFVTSEEVINSTSTYIHIVGVDETPVV
jgi:hypothetical protein